MPFYNLLSEGNFFTGKVLRLPIHPRKPQNFSTSNKLQYAVLWVILIRSFGGLHLSYDQYRHLHWFLYNYFTYMVRTFKPELFIMHVALGFAIINMISNYL